MADGVDLGSAYGRIELDGTQAQQTVDSLAATMRSAGTAMSLGVTAPLVGIGAAAISSAADFEQSLNIMQQVSGATADQMGALQAQALEMGAVTSFSAGEAAQAQLELAKAGLEPMEVMAALPGVLDMAAAGDMNVAQAATIAANAVNMFGLEAGDTTDVANMLAAAANASSSDITDLAAGMQMAGSVFAANGQTIDDLNIGLALLSNNGIAGSDAGTSLKTAMMRLTAPTDEAAAVMANLGVSAFDAQGNMREFPAIMQDLQQALYGTNAVTVTSSNLTADQADRMEYLAKTISKTQTQLANYQSGIAGVAQSEDDKIVAQDRLNRTLEAAQAEYAQLAAIGGTTSTVMKELTEQERQQAMATIFGADAIRSASVIMAEGTDGWNEMADALGVTGAATSTANARMKGMRGAIEYLKGSLDSFLIGVALPFLDSMSGIVRVVADGITAFGALPQPVIAAGLAFAAVLAAAGPLMLAVSGIATAVGFLLSPLGLLIVGIGAAAAGFVLWQSNIGGIQQRAAAFAGQLKDMAEAATGIDFDAVADGLRSLANYIGAVLEDGDYLNDWLTHLPDPIQPAVQALGQLVAAFAGLFQTGDLSAFGEAMRDLFPDVAAAMDEGIAAVSAVVDKVTPIFQGVYDALIAGKEPLGDWSFWWEQMATVVGEDAATIVAGLTEVAMGVARVVAALLAGDMTGVGQRLAGLRQSLVAFGQDIASLDWGGIATSLRDGLVATLQNIGWADALAQAGDWLAGLTAGVVGAIQGVDWAGALTAAGEWLAALRDGVVSAVTSIPWATYLATAGDFVGGLAQGVINRIATINWGALLQQAGDYLAGLRGNVTAALGRIDWGGALATAAGWLDALKTNVTGAIQGIDWAGALTTAGDVFGGLETAVVGGLNALGFTGAADALGNVKTAVGGLPESLAGLSASMTTVSTALAGFWAQASAVGAMLAAFFAPAIGRLQEAFAGIPEAFAPLLPKLQELGGAFGGLLTALQPFVALIGAGLALAVDFGVNRLTTVISSLPSILGPIIDQVTATIRLITTILTEVVAGVKAAIDGDWTAVWESAKAIIEGFSTFFRGLFSRLGVFMGAVARNIAEPIINTLRDLGVDITPLLDGVRKTFEDIWGKVLTYIQPVIDLVGTLTEAIDNFKDFLGKLNLPNPFAGLASAADAVRNAIAEFGGGVVEGFTGQPATEDGSAGGTSYFPGGATAINERGYEQIVLPAGSRVYTNGQTNNRQGDEGRAININLGGVTVNSPMDAHRLGGMLRDQLAMAGV